MADVDFSAAMIAEAQVYVDLLSECGYRNADGSYTFPDVDPLYAFDLRQSGADGVNTVGAADVRTE